MSFKLKPIILLVLILVVAGTTQAQGISAILERLDSLEQEMNTMGYSLLEIQSNPNGSPAPEVDLSAYDASLANIETELTALHNELSEIPALCNEFNITGFVDASYFLESQTGHGSFGLDQVEIDVERTIGDIGSLRFDVEWVSDGAGGFDPDVEQGYVTYSPEFVGGNTFTFGKFNAPIGFELLDAPDMFQYSHALVFDYGLPTNLTGLMFSTGCNTFDFSGYICNGWDVNVDPDNDKSIGGRLGVAISDAGGIGFSAIHGTETTDDLSTTKLTVFDIDLAYDPKENWTMGGEINFGSNDLGEETATWWGFLVMSHWDFSSIVGTTIRFDYFDDQDHSRLGGTEAEVRTAFALAPTFVLGDGMGALIEFRLDSSDQEVFTEKNGDPSKTAIAMAFEMTYTF